MCKVGRVGGAVSGVFGEVVDVAAAGGCVAAGPDAVGVGGGGGGSC